MRPRGGPSISRWRRAEFSPICGSEQMWQGRRHSSTGAGHGAVSMPWNKPPSNGSTGSTITVCASPSETSRQQRQRQTSTPIRKDQTRSRNQVHQPPENPARLHHPIGCHFSLKISCDAAGNTGTRSYGVAPSDRPERRKASILERRQPKRTRQSIAVLPAK